MEIQRDIKKAEEICKRHIFDSNHFDCCMEMAEWKEKQMVEKACDAYCRICDTQECFNDGNCNWVEKFRKAIKK